MRTQEYQTTGMLILSVNKPGWKRTTHQVENKIKFTAAEILRGASSLNLDEPGSKLANVLGRRGHVTGESRE